MVGCGPTKNRQTVTTARACPHPERIFVLEDAQVLRRALACAAQLKLELPQQPPPRIKAEVPEFPAKVLSL
jgi:hypothetical protein